MRLAGRRARLRSAREAVAVGELDRDVAEAQRARDDRDERRQHVGGVHRLAEVAAERLDRHGGLVACAVEQPVDSALQPRAERRERQRAERGGGGRKERAVPTGERADAEHQGGIRTTDDRGEQAVGERPVEHEVDVVEPVADDREGGHDGQAEHDGRARVEERVAVVVRERVDPERDDEERDRAQRAEQPELQLQLLASARRAEAHHQREQRERGDDREGRDRRPLSPRRKESRGILDVVALQVAFDQRLQRRPEHDDGNRPGDERPETRRRGLAVREELKQEHVQRRERRADHPVGEPGEPLCAVGAFCEHPLRDVREHGLQARGGREEEQEPGHGVAGLPRHHEHCERRVAEHDRELDERQPVRRRACVDVLPRLEDDRRQQEGGIEHGDADRQAKTRAAHAPMVRATMTRRQGTGVPTGRGKQRPAAAARTATERVRCAILGRPCRRSSAGRALHS